MKQKLLLIILPLLLFTTTMFAQWVNYCANETPDLFSTPFSTSNLGGTYSTTANGGIMNVTTGDGVDNATGNAMWRQNFSAADPMTVVIRAKVNPDAVRNLAFSIDIDLDPERFEVQIRKYGDGDWRYNISQGYPGSGDAQNAALGINPENEWHIYRFTKTGGAGATCSLYIDENPTPIYTNTTSATGRTNTYFRFGDGWGSGTINSDFDWVIWDNTGAYSPTDQALPAFDSSCALLSTNDFKSPVSANIKAVGNRIYVSNVKTSTEVNIYSITGDLIKSLKTNTDTDFSFRTGLYIATVKTDEGQKAVKLLTY